MFSDVILGRVLESIILVFVLVDHRRIFFHVGVEVLGVSTSVDHTHFYKMPLVPIILVVERRAWVFVQVTAFHASPCRYPDYVPTIQRKLTSSRDRVNVWDSEVLLFSCNGVVFFFRFSSRNDGRPYSYTSSCLLLFSVIVDSRSNFRSSNNYTGSSCDHPFIVSLMSREQAGVLTNHFFFLSR